jgi:hypothetical protein
MTLSAATAGSAPSISDSNSASEPQSDAADSAASSSDNPSQAADQAPAKRKFKVKVDDREEEVDEDEVVKGYQTRRASDARFREAAELRKAIAAKEAEISEFMSNPWKAMDAKGINAREMAEMYLSEKLEWDTMPESEKRRILAEQERDELRAEREQRQKAETERRARQLEAQAVEEIDQEIGQAVQAMGRRPTPRIIARVTETLIADYERQIADLQTQYGDQVPDEAFTSLRKLPADQAVKRVHQEYLADVAEYLASMPVEEAIAVLSKANPTFLDAIRSHEVKRVLSQDPIGSRKPRAEEPRRDRPKKRMSTDDMFENLDKQWG